MKASGHTILVFLIGIYLVVFSDLNRLFETKNPTLQMALPTTFQKVAAGYLQQTTAAILFVKTSVFLGGIKPGTPEESYLTPLAHNFDVLTSLYPVFIDPYYYTQSFLAPISPEGAGIANRILQKGIKAHPDDMILNFFYAFNYYRYLDDPLKSAEVFKEASKFPNAPPMFGHLAAIFSAEAGNIRAGLITLKTMASMEQDERTKKQYQEEIDIFEKALAVEQAVSRYQKKYSIPPEILDDLVPEFLDRLPVIEHHFKLTYEAPVLRLERP